MGRKRLDEEEKKRNLNLKIKQKIYDQVKETGENISQLVEDFLKKWLENRKK